MFILPVIAAVAAEYFPVIVGSTALVTLASSVGCGKEEEPQPSSPPPPGGETKKKDEPRSCLPVSGGHKTMMVTDRAKEPGANDPAACATVKEALEIVSKKGGTLFLRAGRLHQENIYVPSTFDNLTLTSTVTDPDIIKALPTLVPVGNGPAIQIDNTTANVERILINGLKVGDGIEVKGPKGYLVTDSLIITDTPTALSIRGGAKGEINNLTLPHFAIEVPAEGVLRVENATAVITSSLIENVNSTAPNGCLGTFDRSNVTFTTSHILGNKVGGGLFCIKPDLSPDIREPHVIEFQSVLVAQNTFLGADVPAFRVGANVVLKKYCVTEADNNFANGAHYMTELGDSRFRLDVESGIVQGNRGLQQGVYGPASAFDPALGAAGFVTIHHVTTADNSPNVTREVPEQPAPTGNPTNIYGVRVGFVGDDRRLPDGRRDQNFTFDYYHLKPGDPNLNNGTPGAIFSDPTYTQNQRGAFGCKTGGEALNGVGKREEKIRKQFVR